MDLCRAVGALGAKEHAHQRVKRLAALVDLRRSLDSPSVTDSRQIGGIEGLRYTVHFLSVAHRTTERLAALVDLRSSLSLLGVMEDRQIGGIEGLRCTVRFLSVPDEIKDVPSPGRERESRWKACSTRISKS